MEPTQERPVGIVTGGAGGIGKSICGALARELGVVIIASLFEKRAAGVYHNVSTRFADGFRYGFGAELGISTSKLHARGPVGLEGLTTYKYKLIGNGQTVASYVRGDRTFKHRQIAG